MANLGEAVFRVKAVVQGFNRLARVPAALKVVRQSALSTYQSLIKVKSALANFGDGAKFVNKVTKSVNRLNRALLYTVRILTRILRLRQQIARLPGQRNSNTGSPADQPQTNTEVRQRKRDIAGANYVNELRAQAEDIKKAFDDSFGNIGKGLARTGVAFRRFFRGQYGKGFRSLGKAFSLLGKGIINGAAQIASSLVSAGQRITQFGYSLRQFSFILRDAGVQLLAIGVAITGLIALFAKANAEFEQAIADTTAVINGLQDGSDRTIGKINALSNEILRLAETTVFTATEIAQAAQVLGLAGFTFDEVSNSLEGVGQLAAATGASIKDAADLMASIIRSFGLTADSAKEVADVLTATVTNANTDINRLKESFKIVSPAAAAFGQSIQETSAALGVLANAGLRGSIAGTGLSRVLTQLVENAELADEVLRRLGSSFDAIDPRRNSISQIVEEFERLGVGATTLGQLFDQRAFRSLQALINQGSQSLRLLNVQIENSAGLARTISQIKLDTLVGDIKILNSAFESLKITIGGLVNDEIRIFVQTFTQITTKITSFINSNNELVATIAKITAAFGATSTAAGAFLFLLGSLAAAIVPLVIAFGSTISAIGVMGSVVTAVATALSIEFLPALLLIGATLTAITLPIIAITGLLAGFAAAITTAFGTGVINTVKESAETFNQVLDSIGVILGNTVLPAIEEFQKTVEAQLVPAFKEFLTELQALFIELGFESERNTDSFKEFGALVGVVLTEAVKLMTQFVRVLRINKTAIIDFVNTGVEVLFRMVAAVHGLIIALQELTRQWKAAAIAAQAAFEAAAYGYVPVDRLREFAAALEEVENSSQDTLASLDELYERLNKMDVKQFKKFSDSLDVSSDVQTRLNKVIELINKIPDLTGVQADELENLFGRAGLSEIKAEMQVLNDSLAELAKKRMELQEAGQSTSGVDDLIEKYSAAFDKLKTAAKGAEQTIDDLLKPKDELIAERQGLLDQAEVLQDVYAELRDAQTLFRRDDGEAFKQFIAKYQAELNKVGINLTPESSFEQIREAIPELNTAIEEILNRSGFLNKIIPQADAIAEYFSKNTVASVEEGLIAIAKIFADARTEADKLAEKAAEVDQALLDLAEENSRGNRLTELQELRDKTQELLDTERERLQVAKDQNAEQKVIEALEQGVEKRENDVKTFEDAIAEERKRRNDDLADDELARRREIVNGILDEDQKYLAERQLLIEEAAAREKKEFEKVAEALEGETDQVIKNRQAQVKADLDAILNQDLAAIDAAFQEAKNKEAEKETKEKSKNLEIENSITDQLIRQLQTIGQANALLEFRNVIQARNEARAKKEFKEQLKLEDRLRLLQQRKAAGIGGVNVDEQIRKLQDVLDLQRAISDKRLSDADLNVQRTNAGAQGINVSGLQASLLDPGFVANLGAQWGESIAEAFKANLQGFQIQMNQPMPTANTPIARADQSGSSVNDNRIFNITVTSADEITPFI